MSDQRITFRRWAEDLSAQSRPVELDEVFTRAPVHLIREEKTMTSRGRTALIAVTAAVLAATGLALFTAGDEPGDDNETAAETTDVTPDVTAAEATPSTEVERATAFWLALGERDGDAVAASIATESRPEIVVPPRGLADMVTLDRLIDWYEAVDWQWQPGDCVDGDEPALVVCTASATDAWATARGVEPIEGTFHLVVGPGGVEELTEVGDPFSDRWSAWVLAPFLNWVNANHPEDGESLLAADELTAETVDRYRTNTGRYLDAHTAEPSIVVPQVIGLDVTDATRLLEAAGFVDVVVESEASDSVEANIVMHTEPAAGASAAPDDRITIVFSAGP